MSAATSHSWAPTTKAPSAWDIAADLLDPPVVEAEPSERYFGHPVSAKQRVFLDLPNLEALYGGAGGGGKSSALLMAALEYAHVPGYKALLLRKSFSELAQPDGLIPRAHDWLDGTDARWNEQRHRWTFPSGATLTFGHFTGPQARWQYKGAALDYVGFDELTDFDEADYRFLFSRLRRQAGSSVPPRMRAGTNPGGRGHRWVKRRFIDRKPDPDDASDTVERCEARAFVPALLADNPGLDQAAYRHSLDQLDPQTRAQLLEGDWNAREPGPWVYDSAQIDLALELGAELDRMRAERGVRPVDDWELVGIDWGELSTHALVCWRLEGGGLYVLAEVVLTQTEPSEATEAILAAADAYEPPLGWAYYDAAGVQSQRTFAAECVRRRLKVKSDKVAFGAPSAAGSLKLEAIAYLRRLLHRLAEGHSTQVLAISPRCQVLPEQLRGLQWEDEDGRRVRKGDDHGPDALICAVAATAIRNRKLADE